MEGNLFNAQSIVFTGFGAIMLWVKLGREELTVWGLGKLWELFGFKSKLYEVMEFVGFVTFGVVVGIAATHPQTIMQAISAGLGWTGLLSAQKQRAKPSSRNRRSATK